MTQDEDLGNGEVGIGQRFAGVADGRESRDEHRDVEKLHDEDRAR
jgi:hypothetical protein